MNAVMRRFEDVPATRAGHATPLIIGVTAPSTGGKTFSALRLATGIQRVVKGEIYGIDTEEHRMLHYSDYFAFRHVPFDPPHGPLDYLAAIDHCASRGARIVIVDQMSSEHDGEGGVLEQIEDFIERKAGDDPSKRDKYLATAQIAPKRARKKLERRIRQLSASIVFILLYRAEEKLKWKAGGAPDKLGWQPITTSKLNYDMTVRFLLPPGSNGAPILMPTTPAEQMLVKNPEQFKGWFRDREPLSEEMGERLAQWARGGAPANEFDRLVGDYARCTDEATFAALEERRSELWKKASPLKPRLKEAADAARKRLDDARAVGMPAGTKGDAPSDEAWISTLTGQTSSKELEQQWVACIDAYGGRVPVTVGDSHEATREKLIEQEAKAGV